MHYIQYMCVYSQPINVYFEYSFSVLLWFICSCSCPRCSPRPVLQWRALRPVIDVSFSIIYCCILRLHSNPLMARTWPAIRRNQKLWYFWKFLLPAPAAPQNVSPSLSLSLTVPVIIIIYAWPQYLWHLCQCAAQWGRGACKAAAGASIEPFLCDLITRNLRLFLWNMIVVKLFEVFL